MKVIQGFITRGDLINNQVNQVADFFELSPLALTYSKSRAEYQHTSYGGYTLHAYYAKENDTHIILNPEDTLLAFEAARLTLDYTNTYRPLVTKIDLKNYVETRLQLGLDVVVDGFDSGEFIESVEATLPEWIYFKKQDGSIEFRLWLNNNAFENQYPDYEIDVVAPILPVDNFFSNYGNVVAELSKISITNFSERVEEAKGGYPSTYTRYYEFNYYNPNNPAEYNISYWAVNVYGRNGDNIDSIKDAIIDYILTSSTHTQEEWEARFPEIFKRTEFMVFPRWDKYSISNINILSSLYSSIVDPADILEYIERNIPVTSDQAYIKSKLSVLPIDYKGIYIGIIAGDANEDDKDKIYDLYKDYIPVPTSSVDFSRMKVDTQGWVLKMVEAVMLAETATAYSAIYNPYRKIKRNGQLFVTFVYNNINYLVSTRSNNLV